MKNKRDKFPVRLILGIGYPVVASKNGPFMGLSDVDGRYSYATRTEFPVPPIFGGRTPRYRLILERIR